jgi:hypothetical protein
VGSICTRGRLHNKYELNQYVEGRQGSSFLKKEAKNLGLMFNDPACATALRGIPTAYRTAVGTLANSARINKVFLLLFVHKKKTLLLC